jgi:glucose-1-phosphatase
VDLYLFDFDKTLYDYDFLQRLPALSRMSGVSQYDLASGWWAAGYERRAERGEYPDSTSYLDAFARATGAKITLEQWQDARLEAMSVIPGSIAALRRAASLGTVSLFSNNPAIFAESLPRFAPEVTEILDGNVVVSSMLGARKPSADSFRRVLERYGAEPKNTFFADDNAGNVAGGAALGIAAHRFTTPEALDAAITAFAERSR